MGTAAASLALVPDPVPPRRAVVAYDAGTGAPLWTNAWDRSQVRDGGTHLALDPAGTTLYAAGEVEASQGAGVAIRALDVTDGSERWTTVRTEDVGTANGIVLGPDGQRVFAYGEGDRDWVTWALDAETGQLLWQRYHDGTNPDPREQYDHPRDASVGPNGEHVLVVGEVRQGDGYDTAGRLVLYDARTGDVQWTADIESTDERTDLGTAAAYHPSSELVYAGTHSGKVAAYDTSNGTQVWASDCQGPADTPGHTQVLEVGPDGDTLYAAGLDHQILYANGCGAGVATVAVDARTGAPRWTSKIPNGNPAGAESVDMELSADGERLHLSTTAAAYGDPIDLGGLVFERNILTWAVEAGNGGVEWMREYESGPRTMDMQRALGSSPNGDLIVTGGFGETVPSAATAGVATFDAVIVAYADRGLSVPPG